jgi:uncharacterized C2H2 Zn-finger protein
MKVIIRHGDEYKIENREVTCPMCGCVFTYTKEDEYHIMDSEASYFNYVVCPECLACCPTRWGIN